MKRSELRDGAIAAALGEIIGLVAKIDRDSKRDEYTDLDAVWGTLYAIKARAQSVLPMALHNRKGGR